MTYQPLPLPDRVQLCPEDSLAHVEKFRDFMRRRHSVRQFSDAPVAREVITACIETAASAPSGANQQPWHFVAVQDAGLKEKIRAAAEQEERSFYSGGGGEAWLSALEPVGTGPEKPHLTIAPWLIVVFAQRYGLEGGERRKHYYVPESVGIACGLLIAAIHHAGLVTLTHTPNPMSFLNDLFGRPSNEKPMMILPVGLPAADAVVPAIAKVKKPLADVMDIY